MLTKHEEIQCSPKPLRGLATSVEHKHRPAQPRQRQAGRSFRVLVTTASPPSAAIINQAPPNNEPTTRRTSPALIRTFRPALVAMSRVNAIPTSSVSPHIPRTIP
jgi:hypothetical protein